MIVIFIDGFGLGREDPSINPVAAAAAPFLKSVMAGREGEILTNKDYTRAPADANLGVEGLPQSATGQATIMTGINMAAAMGRHINGFPTAGIRKILRKNNLFSALRRKNKKVFFANTYRQEYLAGIENRPGRASVTTICAQAAGLRLNTIEEDLKYGKSLYHDITNNALIEQGYDVLSITPEKAGKVMAKLSLQYDLVFFEYFLTDLAGHAQNMEKAKRIVEELEQFIKSIMENVDLGQTQILIVSDHGNIEDLSIRTHTRNPVPVFAAGSRHKAWEGTLSLTDIMPGILDLFG